MLYNKSQVNLNFNLMIIVVKITTIIFQNFDNSSFNQRIIQYRAFLS